MSSIRDIMNAEDQAVDTKDAGPAVSSSFSSSSLSLASRINNNRNTSNNINDSIDTSTSDDNKNRSSTGNSGHQQKQFHGILSQSQLPSHHHNLYHTSSTPSSSTTSNTASNTTTDAAATNYHLPLRPHAPLLHYKSSPHLSGSVSASASASTSTTSCHQSTTPLPPPPSLPSSGQQSPVFSGGSFPHKDSPSASASSAMDSFHRQSRHNSPSGPPFAPSGPPSSFTSSPRASNPSQTGTQEVKLTPVTGRVSRAKRGIPVHYCQECNKTFTRAEHLRRHGLSHGRPEFPCPFPGCSREFHRKDLLERHRQKHHNDFETGDPVVAYPYHNPSHFSSANPGSSGSAPSRCPSAGSLTGLRSSPGAVFYQSQNLSVPGAAPNQQQQQQQQHQHQHQHQHQPQHQHQHQPQPQHQHQHQHQQQQQPGHPQHQQHTAIHSAAEFPWGRTRSSSMNHAISSTAQNVNVFYPQFPLTGQYPEFHGMEGSNSGSSHAPSQTTGQVGGSGMDVNVPSGHINIVSSQMHTPEPMYSHSYDASFSMPLDFASLDFFHSYGGQQQQQNDSQQ